MPRAPNYLFYLGPDETRSNLQIWEKVQNTKPEFIVYSVRLALIKEHVNPFLQMYYNPVGIGYWVRKDISFAKELGFLKPAVYIFGYYPMPEMLKN